MAYVIIGANDSCVIARSEGARKLGIKMGMPWFQIKHMEHSHNLFALSANFTLYSALSTRMHAIANGLSDRVAPYSIDELFALLDGMPGDPAHRVQVVRNRIEQWLGLPSGAGIGYTKTLAKIASHISKASWRKPGSYPDKHAGLCDLSKCSQSEIDELLQLTAVEDVWGVGRKYAKRLAELDIETALDLSKMPEAFVRQEFGVCLQRTVLELRGIRCFELDDEPEQRLQLACSRSLAKPVRDRSHIEDIAAVFGEQLANKLRLRKLKTSKLSVFAMSSPFRRGPRFNKSLVVNLGDHCNDSRSIVAAARRGLGSIYEAGYAIVKVGVVLMDLKDEGLCSQQLGIDFGDTQIDAAAVRLMNTVDKINDRFGKSSIHLGSAKPNIALQKSEMRCPDYLTDWDHLPIVRA